MSWLWKGDTTSPAQYEKALSKLSTQIAAASVALDTTRNRGRRMKALWTLYTTLTYLVATLILVLVVGPQEWSLPHYSGLIISPALIYAVRFLLTTAFNWRAGRQNAHLQHLTKQRESKINDLKKATKYDSTQELLQKYGGVPPKEAASKPSPSNKQKGQKSTPLPQQQHARTGLPPPPTANIQPRLNMPDPSTPQRSEKTQISPQIATPITPFSPDEPGFAPNAFSAPSQRTEEGQTANWYDRILDVLLGEDETQAKNRLVLLCHNCRLVNGQAPPGIRTLEELGKWRCAGCGAWNGRESEAAKTVKQMTQRATTAAWEDTEPSSVHDEQEPESSDDQNVPAVSGKSTGTEEPSSATKRITRSAGEQPVDGL